MEIKCSKCGKIFEKISTRTMCRECNREYNQTNKQHIKEYNKQRYENNKEIILADMKIYRENNKEHLTNYSSEYYQNNKLIIHEKYLIKYQLNRDLILLNKKQSYLNNPEYYSNISKKSYQKNKQKYYDRFNLLYNNDIEFKLSNNLRVVLNQKLKKNNSKKQQSVIKLIGCTIQEFKEHITQQFLPEMAWSNHGEIWELDHIIPCASFNLSILEEQQKCFHYTNYQPLFKTTKIAYQLGYPNYIGNRNKQAKIL